jgi:AraC-like DNA-binding protein
MSVSLDVDYAKTNGQVFGLRSGCSRNEPAIHTTLAEGGDTVPVFLLGRALENSGLTGFDCNTLLAEATIEPSMLRDENAQITAEQFARFWLAHARRSGDEFFGQDARGLPSGSLALLCHTVLSAATLERAILRMLHFYGVLLSDFEGKLIRDDGDTAEIVLIERGPPRPAFAYCIFLICFLGVAHWLIDRRIPLLKIDFRAHCPNGERHYRRLFGNNLEFDQPWTRIRFDAQFLSMRPIRNEAQMKRFLRDSPQTLIAQYRSRDSISARVWHELRQTLPEAWPSFEELAARMNMTASTLRRRLEAGGTSYQFIKDQARCTRAIEELQIDRKSNAEIAEELGFGDPSAFYRAFRKWTGATPNSFRRQVLANAS